ncbi:MAG TPA: hypothetical protein VGC47_09835 [Acidimicrobiia bacterium]|jgi:hypothetical protein
MRVAAHGLTVATPDGWETRIERPEAIEEGAVALPRIHAATFPLPEERGDFGSGAVDLMAGGDVFVSLLEYEAREAESALFGKRGLPRTLDPERFKTNQLQRWIPGQAGLQEFLVEKGRPFCLYVVIGSFLNRVTLAQLAGELLATIIVESPTPPGIR